jgi:large subunit ribosomal protein L5
MSRLREKFNKEILPELQKDLSIENKMGVPRVEKVIVNMGVGEALENIKFLDAAQKELSLITGQWPAVGRARKSISTFKLREGNPVGCYVTLRGERMYEFLDRLFNVILPRVRDFRGVSPRAFDGRGNYTLGIKDQLVFPEIDYTKVDRTRGMNITIVTSAEINQEAHLLLKKMGMPFAETGGGR